MRKATLWMGVFVLVWFSCVPAPAEKDVSEPEDIDVVTIEIGPTSSTRPDKLERPIPEVPVGRNFRLDVIWVDPVPELSLTLSHFKTVSFHRSGPEEETEESRAFWRWNEGDDLELGDERGVLGSEVVLGFWDAVKDPDGRMVTRRTIRFQRNHDRGPDPRKPSLIFFQTTVKVGDEVKFTYDPPWVEKPPTG